MTAADTSLSVIEAVAGRRSVRRFLATPVNIATVNTILTRAARTASGMNMQPWFVHVVTGAARERVSGIVTAAAEMDQRSPEYAYLPDVFKEPYDARRRKVGHDLYAKYGIDRADYPGRKAAMLRNFAFFGAPVGLFFTIDRGMAMGSWLDCGMFMNAVMVVARAHGLDTCPQQAWCDYGAAVRQALPIPEDQLILSGMALGVADADAAENSLITERAATTEFTIWHD